MPPRPAANEPSVETTDDCESPSAPPYLVHYVEHLDDTRSHILGKTNPESLLHSVFQGGGRWTSEEKDIFFHSLSVRSRLRPDLIAQDIKTKSLPEVIVYLEMLEAGLRDGVGTGVVKWGKEVANRVKKISREDFPIAMEVSDDWCAFEESQAAAIIEAESSSAAHAREKAHEEAMVAQRLSVRAKKGQAKTAAGERDRKAEKARRKEHQEWVEKKKEEWDVEELFLNIDGDTLRAMDMVLREDEESRWFAAAQEHCNMFGMQKDNNADTATPSIMGITETKLIHHSEVEKQHRDIQGIQGPNPSETPKSLHVSEEMIDPVLLASSSTPASSQETAVDSRRASTPKSGPSWSHSYASFNPTTPPFSPRSQPIPLPPPLPSALQIESHEPKDVDYPPPVAESEAGSLLSASLEPSLSPASRRRLHKRMYMRRKRAEKMGVAVDQTLARLKPGRKKKEEADDDMDIDVGEDETPDTPVHADGDHTPTETQSAQGSSTRRSHVSGSTRPYRMRSWLNDIGFDAARIKSEKLHIFHLGKLHKLMRTYDQIHGDPDSVTSTISMVTIKHLYDIVENFTHRMVSLAIASREYEMVGKSRTKVWRLTKNKILKSSNVHHACQLMGIPKWKSNKRLYFMRYLRGLHAKRCNIQKKNQNNAKKVDTSNLKRPTKKPKEKGGTPENVRGPNKRRDDEGEEHNGQNQDISSTPNDVNDPEHLARVKEYAELLKPYVNPRKRKLHPGGMHCYREAFPPFVRLPIPSVKDKTHRPIEIPPLISYTPWNRLYPTDQKVEEDLIPEFTNEDALHDELHDEEELDERDKATEKAYEESLKIKFAEHPGSSGAATTTAETPATADVTISIKTTEPPATCPRAGAKGTKRKRTNQDESDKETQHTGQVRMRKPTKGRSRKRIKSAAIVPDSD